LRQTVRRIVDSLHEVRDYFASTFALRYQSSVTPLGSFLALVVVAEELAMCTISIRLALPNAATISIMGPEIPRHTLVELRQLLSATTVVTSMEQLIAIFYARAFLVPKYRQEAVLGIDDLITIAQEISRRVTEWRTRSNVELVRSTPTRVEDETVFASLAGFIDFPSGSGDRPYPDWVYTVRSQRGTLNADPVDIVLQSLAAVLKQVFEQG